MKLYGYRMSPFVQRALMAARLKGTELPLEPPLGGDLKSPEFLAISPLGRMPVLAADGWTLPESGAIVAYLDETLPGPSLLPADPQARARVRLIEQLVDIEFAAGLRHFVAQKVFRAMDDATLLGFGRDQLGKGLDAIEQLRDAGDRWAVGDAPTAADAALVPVLALAEVVATHSDAGPLHVGRPGIDAYWRRAKADPIAARTADEMAKGFAGLLARA